MLIGTGNATFTLAGSGDPPIPVTITTPPPRWTVATVTARWIIGGRVTTIPGISTEWVPIATITARSPDSERIDLATATTHVAFMAGAE
jgi:hypothetical protein